MCLGPWVKRRAWLTAEKHCLNEKRGNLTLPKWETWVEKNSAQMSPKSINYCAESSGRRSRGWVGAGLTGLGSLGIDALIEVTSATARAEYVKS
jgi:hypothetical protein